MEKINFENLPSTNTPINATNLNTMQNNIENGINDVAQTLEPVSINLTFNEEYVYNTDLEYYCLKIGKVVFLNIRIIAFKKGFEESGTQFISGLPKPSAYLIFYLYGGAEASGTALRCAITSEGTIYNHYSSPTGVGDSANRQYGGTLIYLTNE